MDTAASHVVVREIEVAGSSCLLEVGLGNALIALPTTVAGGPEGETLHGTLWRAGLPTEMHEAA